MWMVGDMVSVSSSSERSAMLTEFRSAMSSTSSSPVIDVSVLPSALRRLPMLGSMCTSIPHIFQSTFRVQVPALLLSVFKQPGGRRGNQRSDSCRMLTLQPHIMHRSLVTRTCLQRVALWSWNILHMYHQGLHLYTDHSQWIIQRNQNSLSLSNEFRSWVTYEWVHTAYSSECFCILCLLSISETRFTLSFLVIKLKQNQQYLFKTIPTRTECITHKHSWPDPLGVPASSRPRTSRSPRQSGCRSSWSGLCWPGTQRSRRWSVCSRWSGPELSRCQSLWCGWPARRAGRGVSQASRRGTYMEKEPTSMCSEKAELAGNSSFYSTVNPLSIEWFYDKYGYFHFK